MSVMYVCARAGCYHRTRYVFCKRHEPVQSPELFYCEKHRCVSVYCDAGHDVPLQTPEVPT